LWRIEGFGKVCLGKAITTRGSKQTWGGARGGHRALALLAADHKGIFHHTPYTVQVAFDLLKSGRVDPEPFISGVRPLEDVVETLESHGRQESIEYEIRPPEGGSS
jgi:threonine dehydrogenase-like Zn-dependent dehydrogenase